MKRKHFGDLHVLDAAAILDGRVRIGALAVAARTHGLDRSIDFVVVPGLSLAQEIDAFRTLRPGGNCGAQDDEPRLHAAPEETVLPALRVQTDWVSVQILSEPHLVRASRGYAPLLGVRELESGRVYGLYAGARSLCDGLEELRQGRESLIGRVIRLRRESGDHYATYQVEPLANELSDADHRGAL